MKNIIYISLLLIMVQCTIIKNTGEYPDNFIITNKVDSKKYTFYFEETNRYYIYYRKDIFDINDTVSIKPVFFNKYLKMKK